MSKQNATSWIIIVLAILGLGGIVVAACVLAAGALFFVSVNETQVITPSQTQLPQSPVETLEPVESINAQPVFEVEAPAPE